MTARAKTVLVCAAQAPFITGGAEILVAELRANLERRGFRVDAAENDPPISAGAFRDRGRARQQPQSRHPALLHLLG